MFYVYVLRNQSDKLYIGYSSDLKRRMQEHQRKHVPSTASGDWKLVYYEAYLNEKDARYREQRLKDGRAQTHLRRRISSSLFCDIK